MSPKPKYETPILIPLGATARGSGVCSIGSSVSSGLPWGDTGTCSVGTCVSPGITDCAPGAVAFLVRTHLALLFLAISLLHQFHNLSSRVRKLEKRLLNWEHHK